MSEQAFIAYLLILVVGAAVLEALVLAMRNSANWRPRESITNVVLGITNLVVGILFAAVNLAVYHYLHEHFSVDLGLQGFWPNLLLAVLVYDFLYWLNHWAHHHLALLWCNHLVHHSGKAFNLTTAVRIGWLGNFTVWFFFLPMAMLGIPLTYYLLAVAAQLVYQFFIHTSMVPPLGVLEKVLVTPSQHRVHHASNAPYLDKNFGCFFVIWDRLFGTYQAELDEVPVVYGITTPLRYEHAPGYLNAFLYGPFLRTALSRGRPWAVLKVLLGGPENIRLSTANVQVSEPAMVGSSRWIEFLGPTLLGFYLALQYPSLSPNTAWITASVFLLAANVVGLDMWSPRFGRVCLLLAASAQVCVCLMLLFESTAHGYLLIAALLSAGASWGSSLWPRKPTPRDGPSHDVDTGSRGHSGV